MKNQGIPKSLRNRALHRKALLACQQENYSEATADLQYIFDSNPEPAEKASASYLQGDVLKAQNQFEQAIPFYRQTGVLQPGTRIAQAALGSEGDCLFAIASGKNDAAKFSEALSVYGKLLETDGLLPEYEMMTRYKTGRCYQLQNDPQKAAFEYKKLIDSLTAKQIADNPQARFWSLKALNELESIALKNSDRDLIEIASSSVRAMTAAALLTPDEAKKRNQALLKHKRK